MDAQALARQIHQVVDQALSGTGVEVDDVIIHPAGRRRLVRVTVARDLTPLEPEDHDSPVQPLSLDEIAEATRLVSRTLDDTDVLGAAPYTLEVSSPGVDQPLTTPTRFRRNVGRLLSLHLGDRELSARLLAVSPEGIRLEDDPGRVVPFDEVTRARVQVEFTRPTSGKERR